MRTGNPQEKLCFQCNIAAERKELEELEKHINKAKDLREQGQRHRDTPDLELGPAVDSAAASPLENQTDPEYAMLTV
eukprot:2287024-Rhodomonas_salina.1